MADRSDGGAVTETIGTETVDRVLDPNGRGRHGMTTDDRPDLVARFIPAPGGERFRSARGSLLYKKTPKGDSWEGRVLVVTPGGCERVVRLQVYWQDAALTVSSKLENIEGGMKSGLVVTVTGFKGGTPAFVTRAFDYLDEDVGVHLLVRAEPRL